MTANNTVNVSVSVSARGVTAKNYNVPLVASARVPWTTSELFRAYASTAAMAADGFDAHDAAYQLAGVLLDASPSVPSIMVGKRTAFTQVIELTPSAPGAGVLYQATLDGSTAMYTASGGDSLAAVCTALATAINAGVPALPTAILSTGGASSAAPQTLTGAALNGAVGTGAISPPRPIEGVFNANASWHATSITVTGKNPAGATITDTIAVAAGGGTTVRTTKLFAAVTEIDIPTQGGAGGTVTFGFPARATADGTSGTKVVVTTTDAGVVVPYTAISATLAVHNATTDPGITADLTAIRAASSAWYGLLLDSNGAAETLAAAAWAENNEVLFGAQSADTACASSASTTDVFYVLQHQSYQRTHYWFTTSVGSQWLAAGITGLAFALPPGSETWALKTLAGVATSVLSDTQQTALDNKNANYYVEDDDGEELTENGTVASGQWIDVVRGVDWLRATLRAAVKTWVLAVPKRAYTDDEVDALLGVVRGVLKSATRKPNQLLAPTPAPTASAPTVDSVDPGVRAARHLPNVLFGGRLAGALQEIDLVGSLSE